jgi:hypothetical protein
MTARARRIRFLVKKMHVSPAAARAAVDRAMRAEGKKRFTRHGRSR